MTLHFLLPLWVLLLLRWPFCCTLPVAALRSVLLLFVLLQFFLAPFCFCFSASAFLLPRCHQA
jgi:hypothetical protein